MRLTAGHVSLFVGLTMIRYYQSSLGDVSSDAFQSMLDDYTRKGQAQRKVEYWKI
jgi:hypothetical protein